MNYVFSLEGVFSATERIVASDEVQQFNSEQYTRNEGSAIAALITCEANKIRFCVGGSDPTQGDNGLGHILYVGQSLRLTNPGAIRTFKYINHTNGADSVLQVSFEFELGR